MPIRRDDHERAPTVLVAEDDDEMRFLMTRALTRDGYQVIAAFDAASLIASVRAAKRHGALPDLIVSDVRMPHMTGLQMVRQLRADGCDVPVVLVSAFVDQATVEEAARLGVAHVLSKPFELDDLRMVAMNTVGRPRHAPAGSSSAAEK